MDIQKYDELWQKKASLEQCRLAWIKMSGLILKRLDEKLSEVDLELLRLDRELLEEGYEQMQKSRSRAGK